MLLRGWEQFEAAEDFSAGHEVKVTLLGDIREVLNRDLFASASSSLETTKESCSIIRSSP